MEPNNTAHKLLGYAGLCILHAFSSSMKEVVLLRHLQGKGVATRGADQWAKGRAQAQCHNGTSPYYQRPLEKISR